MKKITSILLILVLGISLYACGDKKNNKSINNSKIESASLTEEESNILQLFELNHDSRIFDYIVDEKAKSIHIKQYILDENSEWKEHSGSSSRIGELKGRIAISINEDGGLRIAIQDKNGVSSSKYTPESLKDITDYGKSTSWADISDIVYNEEIPLAIQIITTSNSVSSYGVESFFNPPKFQENDTVIAVTITFSEDQL